MSRTGAFDHYRQELKVETMHRAAEKGWRDKAESVKVDRPPGPTTVGGRCGCTQLVTSCHELQEYWGKKSLHTARCPGCAYEITNTHPPIHSSGVFGFPLPATKLAPPKTLLAILRVRAGMTQDQLAARLGCHTKTVDRLENRKQRLTNREIRLGLARIFHRAVDDLLAKPGKGGV